MTTRRWLRWTLLLVATMEASCAAVLLWWGLTEERNWRIMRPISHVAAVFLVACMLPAFILAWRGRSLWLSALLLALPVGTALWGHFS